jgi:endonuclease/exonuclease/phosphatase family metal-dependent hydrolase
MRLLTYNIHKGIGGADRRYRLERIVQAIAAEEPDFVCLQEVDRNVRRTEYDDQPRLLADQLGAEAHLFQLNVPIHNGGYGNLLLSRWPFQRRHQVSLRHGEKKPRGAQMVVVDTPEGALHLVNWHLGLREKERRWQADHLLAHALFRESWQLPTMIVGDYNDWRNVLGPHSFDCHGFAQATDPVAQYRSFPAFWPIASLDKVYHRGPLKVSEVRVVNHKLTRRASDHLPLVVDFHLIKPPPKHHAHTHRG